MGQLVEQVGGEELGAEAKAWQVSHHDCLGDRSGKRACRSRCSSRAWVEVEWSRRCPGAGMIGAAEGEAEEADQGESENATHLQVR